MLRRHFLTLVPAAALAQQSRPSPAKAPTAQRATSDWPQWHGSNRDNKSTETGLQKEWPGGGPKLLWSAKNLGAGYGSLAISGDQIYVQGTKGSESVVWALNRADGKHLGHAVLGASQDDDRGGGPRGTPTVDGDVLYVLTENGDLGRVNRKTAQVEWKRNILRDYDSSNPQWLISESPLLDGNKLIVSPGGRKAVMVAVDKNSGKDIWTSTGISTGPGYSSAIAADVGGVRTYINLMHEAGIGVRASDGKLLWQYTKACNNVANCTTPVFSENKVFFTSAYGTGCGLVALTPNAQEVNAQEVYFSRDMQNHHGGVILHNGFLYGFSNAILTCMEFNTGKVRWRDRSVGKGSLTYADGNLYLLGENNVVGLAALSPDAYVEKGRFNIEDQGRPSWAHPVVAGGKLYIRNQGLLNCYDIRA
ncbi:MAG TPA: PQQ-binding-like beta-propeller repeat protein [Bryobacteraceae bacterium]|nr:PQQ-binding-like beta-propeller repeat protein [Bryobacteraceae bacterium]